MTIENNIVPKKEYDSVLTFAKDLTCEPVLKSNCKLCQSPFRKEAEDQFIEGKSPHSVYKWLKTKGETVSSNAVHNHLVNHFQKASRELQLKNYAENLEEYCKIKANEEDRLRIYLSVLDKQIHELGSSINHKDTDGSRKTLDTIAKLMDMSLKVQDQINKTKQDNEPIKVILQKVNNVLTIKYNETSNQEAKKIVGEIVEILIKETESIENVN